MVAGAGGGIGRATALRLAAEGAIVGVADVDLRAAQDVVNEFPSGQGIASQLDVVSQESVEEWVADLVKVAGRLDVLVNCAGVLSGSRAENIGLDEWSHMIGVHLTGTFLCCKGVYPSMRESGGGRIVNLASMAGRATSTTGGAHYTAAKAGVLGLTRHLAREWAGDHIAVNAVSPGMVDTSMISALLDERELKDLASSIPFGRLGRPDEIAVLIAFLASDEASYITGASVDIHGGEIIVA